MSFLENLENRSLLSATPTFPWTNFTGAWLAYNQTVPHEWTEDTSGAPEAQPTWINTVTGQSLGAPLLSASGRLQISGTTQADQISVEQVTGLDTTSDLPAFILHSDQPQIIQHFADASGKGSYTPLNGGGSVAYSEAQPGSLVSTEFNYDFVASQSNQLPDLYGGLSPANTVLNQYQLQEQILGDSDDGLRIADFSIPGINSEMTQYQDKIAKYANTGMTRVRVAGMYDVYVMGSAPITIAMDTGAGNDTVSVAANVPDKTSILGGKGDDMLISGKMHTYLAGGAGNDTLISRSKHGGTLDGGAGSDTFESKYTTMAVTSAGPADFVAIRGQSFPIATAVSALKASAGQTVFSQIFITPDGLA